MKWLLLLGSFFLKPLMSSQQNSPTLNPIEDLKDLIKEKAAIVAVMFAAGISLSILFASGLIMAAMNASAQYDLNSVVYFNTMIGTGLGISLVTFLIGVFAIKGFQADDKKEKKKAETLSEIRISHPLQDAIALLIADIIKEREFKRSQYSGHLYEQDEAVRRAHEEQELRRH